MYKLEACGVTKAILNWIESFLINHRQRVCIKGSVSPWSPVISGVPQGSVLGSMLFIICMNDLSDVIKSNLLIILNYNHCISSLTDWTFLQTDLENFMD